MNRVRKAELDAFREESLSVGRDTEFEASARATTRWERSHSVDVDGILDWIEQLRVAFGDPAVDLRPWFGSDFRL